LSPNLSTLKCLCTVFIDPSTILFIYLPLKRFFWIYLLDIRFHPAISGTCTTWHGSSNRVPRPRRRKRLNNRPGAQ
jgi:hypothetical protein